MAGYSNLFSRNHLKDYHCVFIGWALYMHQFCGFTTSQRIVKWSGFFFANTIIWWLFRCFCLLLSSRWMKQGYFVILFSFYLFHLSFSFGLYVILLAFCLDILLTIHFFFQPKFLDLAFGAALAAFLTLEIIRVSSAAYLLTVDTDIMMFS